MIAEFCWALLEFGLFLGQLHTAGAHSISHLPTWLCKLQTKLPQCIWMKHIQSHIVIPIRYSSGNWPELVPVGGGVSSRHAYMNCFFWQNTRWSCGVSALLSSGNYVYYVQQIPICHMAYCACEVHHHDFLWINQKKVHVFVWQTHHTSVVWMNNKANTLHF